MIIEVVADDDHHFLLSYIEGKQKCKQVQNIKKTITMEAVVGS
jgi:hypothetical protein